VSTRQRDYRAPYFSVLAAAIIAFVLGVFGPSLDQARQDETVPVRPGEAELIDAEARHACGEAPTDNAGWLQDAHGAYVCTDKHGRRHRSLIVTAIKVQQ
jgi:hypothetical protein